MKIALIGNQNSGKTTLFNVLTGMNQKIGNWPGVTIEKKEGIIKGTHYKIVDLPGIYSLSPYTLDEEIACNFLFQEKPDLIVNVIDVNSLERSLYLTMQLLEFDIPLIVALNMTDVLLKKGGLVNGDRLGELLGVDVVLLAARQGTGVKDLIDRIGSISGAKRSTIRFSSALENKILTVSSFIKRENSRFIAIKLLEKDPRFQVYSNPKTEQHLKHQEEDFEEIVATERYRIIDMIKTEVMTGPILKETLSDKIDRFVLNKYWAYPIFIIIVFLLYFTVALAGGTLGGFMKKIFRLINEFTEQSLLAAGATPWIVSLLVNGIISGIGAVLTFIPQIAVLFLVAALLESTGYLSRVSFLLDKLFNRLGLSGRTLIPFIVGFGCSVPGVMATRTIENVQERKSAVILVPFIPCGAKLPIISLFAGFFFKKYRVLISTSLFFLSLFIIIISALILKRIFRTEASTYISELPEYRLPDFKYVFRDTWEKTFAFIKRAGSVILIGSVVVWVLLSFSFDFRFGVAIEESILAGVGNLIAWFFYPIIGTWSWAAGVSALQGLVAKEQVVASLNIIAGLSGDIVSAADVFIAPTLAFFTPASAYAFMAFNLFSAPCIGAISAMRKELGSTAAVIKATLFQTGMAWTVSSILYALLSVIGRLI